MHFEADINHILSLAIAEDLGSLGDITTQTCVPPDLQGQAVIYTKQKGLIAGLAFLPSLFQKIDPQLSVKLLVQEGSFQKAGASLAEITGPAQGLMTGERSALNFLQHLCGIATITADYVKKVAGYPCAILDTRKTLPGLRALEKYAVQLGGGRNHRFALDDRFIIKHNHLTCLDIPYSESIPALVTAAKNKYPKVSVEIEINKEELLHIALKTPIDAVLLYGLPPDEVANCVRKGHLAHKKVYFESSAFLSPDHVLNYAKTGLDGIAIGSITCSTQAMDIGMRLNFHKDPFSVPLIKKKQSFLSKLFNKHY